MGRWSKGPGDIGRKAAAVFLFMCSNAQAAEPAAELALVNLPSLQMPRAAHQAVVLKDGRVLIAGGCTAPGCESVQSTTELYDPASQSFHPATPMITRRVSHAALLLPDGRVFIVGGWTGTHATADAEIFDVAKNRSRLTEAMHEPRIGPTAVLLRNGKVLVAGGEPSSGTSTVSMEIFDPEKGRFSKAGNMVVPRAIHTATLLRDGRVLIVGGQRGREQILSSAEIFDPATGTSRPTGSLNVPRHKHAAVLLADGRVLIVGGANGQPLDSTELYDPQTRKFSAGPAMNAARYKIPDAVAVLPSGVVAVVGGAPTSELWAPGEPVFASIPGSSAAGSMAFSTASVLPTGEVLVVGGYDERTQPSAAAMLLTSRR